MAKQQVKILTLDEIMAAKDVEERVVEVPEWGGSVKVRALTKGEAQRIRRETMGPNGEPDPEKLEAYLLAYGLAEPQITVEQAQALLEQKSNAVVERILREIVELNGWSQEQQKVAVKAFRPGNA